MEIFNFIIHIDDYLAKIVAAFGPWTYVILFGIIFAETGLVVAPFLPGDSLLFAVGALAGLDVGLNVWIAYFSLLFAAILGDSVNYWFGKILGARAFNRENSRIFKKAYLDKTQQFYEKYGGKTIIIARFVPIVRTFAPFVAGIGKMKYSTFFMYNIIGAFIWVTSLVFAGYFFGSLPIIKENFETAIFAIIFISLLPMIYEFISHKRAQRTHGHTTFKEVKETIDKKA